MKKDLLFFSCVTKKSNKSSTNFWKMFLLITAILKKLEFISTCLSQVIVGTGLPEAVHSKLTSVPFLTTIFPSSGLGLILGGTEKFKKWRKRLITRFSWKRAGNTTLRYLNFFTIVCASVLLLLLKKPQRSQHPFFPLFLLWDETTQMFPKGCLIARSTETPTSM